MVLEEEVDGGGENLKKIVGSKVLQFINNKDQEALWSQNPWRKDAVTSTERMMNQSNFCFWSHNACIVLLHHFLMTLKIILIYV